jgi:hypothetical protein
VGRLEVLDLSGKAVEETDRHGASGLSEQGLRVYQPPPMT